MSENSFPQNQFPPIYALLERATMGQKTYETNISILPAIEALSKKSRHTLYVSFSRRASKASVKVCLEGTQWWSREGQNAGVKNPQGNRDRLHWYSMAAIELWVFGEG